MKKRIVIHAGLPKTATSFLQESVFPNIPGDQCAFNPPAINHMLLELCKEVVSGGTLTEGRVREMRIRIDRELLEVQAPALLISVEGLLPLHCGGFTRADRILAILKQLFDDPVIVVFLREQSAWIRSAYSFCLVSKFILPFDQYVNRIEEGRFGDRIPGLLSIGVFDYHFPAIRELVQRHFKTSFYFSFEELFGQQDQVLQRLAAVIGVQELTVRSSSAVNKGLDEGLMVLISRLAARIPFRSQWRKAYLFPRYSRPPFPRKIKFLHLRHTGQLARLIARLLYRLAPPNPERRLFSSGEEAHIKAYYHDENLRFWQAEGGHELNSDQGAGQ